MKMKKTCLIAVCLAAALCGASACSGGKPDTPLGGGELIKITKTWWSTTGEVKYGADGSPEFNNVSLDLTTVVSGDDLSALRDIVNMFNSEYEGQIFVNLESLFQDTFEKTIAQRISQNANAPDLIMSHQKAHRSFADSKLIQPLDEAYSLAKIEYDASNYLDGMSALTNLGYADYNFSVAADAQSLVIYYNKQILSDLGKEIPTTHAELLDVCSAFAEKYKGSDDYAVSCGVTDNNYFQKYLFLTMYMQNGGELYNGNTFLAEWNSGSNLEAFKATDTSIKDLTKNGYFKYGENLSEAETRFFENRSLFLIDRPWYSQSLFSAYKVKNPDATEITDVIGGASVAGLFALDASADTAQLVFGDSHQFAMPTTVKNAQSKAAAAVFIDWFTNNVRAGTAWGEAGHVSASKSVLKSAEYNSSPYISTFLNGFYSSPDQFVTIGNTPYYAELTDRLYDVATQCLTSPTNIETIVEVKSMAFNEYVRLAQL